MFGPAGFAARVKTRPMPIFLHVVQLFRRNCFVVNLSDLLFDFKCAVATHEFQRRQILRGGSFRQTGNGVIEDPFVVFVDAESSAGILFRFGVLANSERAIRIDAPGQLEPEFVLFPHFARIDLARVVNRLRRCVDEQLSSRAVENRATANRVFRKNVDRVARSRRPSAKRSRRSKRSHSTSA